MVTLDLWSSASQQAASGNPICWWCSPGWAWLTFKILHPKSKTTPETKFLSGMCLNISDTTAMTKIQNDPNMLLVPHFLLKLYNYNIYIYNYIYITIYITLYIYNYIYSITPKKDWKVHHRYVSRFLTFLIVSFCLIQHGAP